MNLLAALFRFEGRLARLPAFCYGLLAVALYWLVIAGSLAQLRAGGVVLTGLLIVLACGAWVWMASAIMVKRLHDLGKSGFWALLFWLVPLAGILLSGPVAIPFHIANILLFLWLSFWPGEAGANRYGPPPGRGSGAGADAIKMRLEGRTSR